MRNLTIRQLRAVRSVCSTGKISESAKLLGLSAPAVTLQIQQLEQTVGAVVFDRTKEGMKPTEAGKAVLEASKNIDDELSILGDLIKSIKGLKVGGLRLGVTSTGKYFAPKLIAGFLKEYSDIDVSLFIGNREEVIERLRDHEVDIALMGRPPNEFDVRSQVIGDHPLVFIASPDHPLANQIDISKERLGEEKLLIREAGSGTRVSLEIFLSDVRHRLATYGVEMDSNETLKQAVIAGLGISFISGHTIEQELMLKRLVILDVQQTPIRRQWFSVSRKNQSVTPAMKEFDTFLRTKALSYFPIVPKTYPIDNPILE